MMLTRLLRRPLEDVHIRLPGVEIAFNHRLKLAFLYDTDPTTPENRYDELEKHLDRHGYFLQIIAAAPLPFEEA